MNGLVEMSPQRHSSLATAKLLLVLTGALLALPAYADVNVSGSAYVDYFLLTSKKARETALQSVTPEAALRIEVDVHDRLSFSGRICSGCHGVEVDRAHIDFTVNEKLTIQAGRIGVPFGDFAVRYDPTSHRAPSKPLIYEMGRMAYYGPAQFNLGVVPMPYVDNGAVLYGQVWLSESAQLWYGGYVVGGLKGENDLDLIALRSSFYTDNNRMPAGGGRLVLTLSSSEYDSVFKDFTFGLSGMHGRYDSGNTRPYTALGVDASVRVGPATLRGEVAAIRVNIDPNAPGYRYRLIDPYFEKSGAYVELEHPLGSRLIMVYRWDALRRAGIPLPSSDVALSTDSRIQRGTLGTQFLFTDAVFLKAAYEYWYMNDYPKFHAAHFGLGGSF